MKKIIIAESIIHAISGHDTMFGRGNIATYLAHTSEEILNIHGARKVDIIISDAALPLMGGAKLCSAIRSDAFLKNVSIIMIGDDTGEALTQCREAGANAVISKQSDPIQIFSKLSELLVIPQRKDLRVSLRASVKGRGADSSFFAMSQNISISGMLLETDRVIEKGNRLTCAFTIAHSEIIVECMVIREERPDSGKRRYGVQFLNIDMKSFIIIEHFVKSQTKPQ